MFVRFEIFHTGQFSPQSLRLVNQNRQVLGTNPELGFLKTQGQQRNFLLAAGAVNTFGL
ncbi:MAG: hypothetical protein KatS3mg045_0415 [Bellilinea sp.]|nr:MAG: hypothetical protein KatS3mg045_0415 [Bellilinea sp.]